MLYLTSIRFQVLEDDMDLTHITQLTDSVVTMPTTLPSYEINAAISEEYLSVFSLISSSLTP